MTLVLPDWVLDPGVDDTAHDMYAPFGYFFDVEHFVRYSKEHLDLRVATELPHRLARPCIDELQQMGKGCPPSLGQTLTAWGQRHGVACIPAYCAFFCQLEKSYASSRPQGQLGKRKLRPGLKPALHYQREVGAVLRAFRARFNSSSFAVLHARLEKDWVEACRTLPFYIQSGKQCVVPEEEMAAFLEPRLPLGSVLLIVGGLPIEHFKVVCTLYKCWQREMVRPDTELEIAPTLASVAFLSYLLSLHGQAFYGNRLSTFSKDIIDIYRQFELGLTGFYNDK